VRLSAVAVVRAIQRVLTQRSSKCRYFFKALDVEHRGKLTATVVSMWCSHLHKLVMQDVDQYEFNPLDVKDEFFDIVKPKNKAYVTLKDINALPEGRLTTGILGMLCDVACFYFHESLCQ
jgi:serine/threonine-protein phosphatase 2A regulatory subunit B''